MASIDIANVTQRPVFNYNYGDPRVGNYDFTSIYKSYVTEYWRVVNELDLVPHVPPRFLGFYHNPTEVWYYNDVWKICNGSGEDPNCSDSLVVALSIIDHMDYMGVKMGMLLCFSYENNCILRMGSMLNCVKS